MEVREGLDGKISKNKRKNEENEDERNIELMNPYTVSYHVLRCKFQYHEMQPGNTLFLHKYIHQNDSKELQVYLFREAFTGLIMFCNAHQCILVVSKKISNKNLLNEIYN